MRIDLGAGRVDVLLDDTELDRRRAENDRDPFAGPESQTPWHELARAETGQFDTGAVIERAVKYQRIAQTRGLPRDSH